jgi:hypothetical protein
MTGAINAKSDVLGERELDAVSGGSVRHVRPRGENEEQLKAMETFAKALKQAGSV